MKVAILTSPNQWFVPYAEKLNKQIKNSKLFLNHKDIDENYSILFILGYHKIIEQKYLDKNKHNIVVHESALPEGKGWAPMFWQILENKDKITFSMFEASKGVDDGDIYIQSEVLLSGYELNTELREKQAIHTMKMCLEFLNDYDKFKIPRKQNGKETFYKKRSAKDSELDIHKTINEQFNLLRIVNNEDYPAFFYKDDKKYILRIEEVNDENR